MGGMEDCEDMAFVTIMVTIAATLAIAEILYEKWGRNE